MRGAYGRYRLLTDGYRAPGTGRMPVLRQACAAGTPRMLTPRESARSASGFFHQPLLRATERKRIKVILLFVGEVLFPLRILTEKRPVDASDILLGHPFDGNTRKEFSRALFSKPLEQILDELHILTRSGKDQREVCIVNRIDQEAAVFGWLHELHVLHG